VSRANQLGKLRREIRELREHIARLEEENRQLKAQLARANKDSTNSSKPPSSDIAKPAPKGRSGRRGRKIGGQPGHPRHQRTHFPPEQVDHWEHHHPRRCEHCGGRDLQEDTGQEPQVFQQVELVDKPFKVTEHVLHCCRCERCHKITTGRLPSETAATGLVGPRMLALLLFMKGALRLSYSGIQEFLDHVLGFKVSRGYLAKMMNKGAQILGPPVQELRSLLPSQPVLNVDETGHKENGQRMWTWCFRAPDFVLFAIRASRGSDVLLEHLGEEFDGILGCDYFSAYRKFMGQMSGTVQFCLAHLIRDLKFLAEHPDPVIQLYAQPILKAIKAMFHLIHQQVERPMELEQFQSKLLAHKKRLLSLCTNTAAVSPIEWYVKKHYSEIWNLAERFRKHGDAYFTFITTPAIDPTNNTAEQAVRFVVMDRRATQGTRGQTGRTFCERIWSVVGTCRMNRRSIFNYLSQAVTAWTKSLPIPPLIPSDPS